MKKLIIITASVLSLNSCKQNSETSNEVETTIENKDKTIKYEILSEEENVKPEFGINKCNINIELREKISVDELTKIANELRETRTTYDNLWIFYYLPGMKVDSGAWATSHFTPNLNVEIIGSTLEEETKLKGQSKNVDGKILGEFFEKQYVNASFTVYEKDNKTFVKIAFKDGSSSIDEMSRKKVTDGIRLDQKSEGNGEYYILTNSGILEFYNAENKKFTTADKN
ncbi:hypothetical protein [Flavobacterium sp.]|uniref:hypothetical protein n=1 Tax=Flavobacterium sp. TaxID=239 RepID=UPI00261B7F36|nr:hypothetical protein [Flavobacterium sp.]